MVLLGMWEVSVVISKSEFSKSIWSAVSLDLPPACDQLIQGGALLGEYWRFFILTLTTTYAEALCKILMVWAFTWSKDKTFVQLHILFVESNVDKKAGILADGSQKAPSTANIFFLTPQSCWWDFPLPTIEVSTTYKSGRLPSTYNGRRLSPPSIVSNSRAPGLCVQFRNSCVSVCVLYDPQ